MACAAFTVLLGVLLMHSVPMVHPPGHGASGATAASAVRSDGGHHADVDELTAAVAAGSGAVLEMGCSDGCSPHVGMAMCMAVVSVVAALLMVQRLLTYQPAAGAQSHMLWMGRHSSRAPPWATPSLEKLSVLRI
ncbi:hypothetical protein BFL43_03910 [Williamsia sp. 1135]|jgi:hypothetical protein|nr:hypothetical protein BFL43_03910 [Williamsia sp. 1135]